ncbi:hypothetical protein [Sporosarcina sp. FA9]|uniref:hypothetical protein n=1 Tax=Sporosarcina sp. FA9 TaxID=3413030 RepID=UPI003F65A90B
MFQIRKLLLIIGIGLLLSGCITIPSGDGGKIKISKQGIEFEDKDGEKANLEMDTDEGGFTVNSEDGSKVKVGSHAELPENFPSDILTPSEGTLLQSGESLDEDTTSFMVNYSMTGDRNKTIDKFKNFLLDNDYEYSEMILGEEFQSIQGEKEGSLLIYGFMGNDEEYILSISYFEEK